MLQKSLNSVHGVFVGTALQAVSAPFVCSTPLFSVTRAKCSASLLIRVALSLLHVESGLVLVVHYNLYFRRLHLPLLGIVICEC